MSPWSVEPEGVSWPQFFSHWVNGLDLGALGPLDVLGELLGFGALCPVSRQLRHLYVLMVRDHLGREGHVSVIELRSRGRAIGKHR